jgi:putative ABC transport system permease protein
VLSPVIAVPAAGAVGGRIAPVFRSVGRLAHGNAVRNPERTAKTASALMIGLALVTTVSVVGASMKKSFAASLERTVSADLVLSTTGASGFSPALTAALGALPQIEHASGIRFNTFLFQGHRRDVAAVDTTSLPSLMDIDVQDGSLDGLASADGILVHQDAARDLGVHVGDRVDVELATGPRQLVVAGTYADATYVGDYLMDLSLFARSYPRSDLDLLAFATVAPTSDAAAARTAVEGLLSRYPQVHVQDRAEFEAAGKAQFDSNLLAVDALLGLALFIALLGVANTLALSVLERTREIGLMRAVGMLRRQAREMVVIESAMVSVFGALLGIAVGLALGLAVTVALPSTVVSTTAVPVRTIAAVIGLAAGCGIAAGLVPARRAARLDVLRAMAAD